MAIKLDEIKSREAKASKGPWETRIAGIEGDNYVAGTGPWYRMSHLAFDANDQSHEDARFIAHSREDIPYLLKRLEAAEAALRTYADRNSWSCLRAEVDESHYCKPGRQNCQPYVSDGGILARRYFAEWDKEQGQ